MPVRMQKAPKIPKAAVTRVSSVWLASCPAVSTGSGVAVGIAAIAVEVALTSEEASDDIVAFAVRETVPLMAAETAELMIELVTLRLGAGVAIVG